MNNITYCKSLYIFLAISFSLFISNKLSAQEEIRVEWAHKNYTNTESSINNITPQSDGTYLATGAIIINNKQSGYVLHINEDGEVIETNGVRGEYILTPPADSVAWKEGIPRPVIKYAYLTSDNSIMAFGEITNAGLGASHPSLGWVFNTAVPRQWMKNGLWVTKVHRETKNIAINKLDRGNSRLTGSILHKNDQFIVTGFDYKTLPGNPAVPQGDFLFRVYDKDGAWLYDNYSGGHAYTNNAWVEDISRMPDGNYTVTSLEGVFKYNSSTFAQMGTGPVVTRLDYKAGTVDGCLERPTANVMDDRGHHSIFYPRTDGGFWACGRMGSAGGTYALGYILYYKDAMNIQSNNCIAVVEKNRDDTVTISSILALPGSSTKYVSNHYDDIKATHSLYIIEDIGSRQFKGTLKEQFKYNTALKTVSLKEGFFSAGQDPVSKTAAIVKYSTCSIYPTNIEDEYIPKENTVNFKRSLNYKDAIFNTAGANEVDYVVEIWSRKGTVDSKPENSLLKSYTGTAVRGTQTGNKVEGKLLDINENFNINSKEAELEVLIYLTNRYMNNTTPQKCEPAASKIKVLITLPSCTLFSDDIWFFGENDNLGTSETSKGMEFKKLANGQYDVRDRSNFSKVNSWENTISVSTPACAGSFIFYGQHNYLFNSKNEVMSNGYFKGHTSNGDGLAAAYIGDNKYILVTVDSLERLGHLKYSIVNMNGDGGFGKLENNDTPISSLAPEEFINESTELIPRVGTTDQYWLVYNNVTTAKIEVRLVDGSNPTKLVSEVLKSTPHAIQSTSYTMRPNATYTKLAMTNVPGTVTTFNFDPLNGDISTDRSYDFMTIDGNNSGIYGLCFSPNGKYLYVANWRGVANLYQVDLAAAGNGVVSSLKYSNNTSTVGQGAGMKLGPDGKIYITREAKNYMAVLSDPNSLMTSANFKMDGFELKAGGLGLGVSTGLTPPWIDPDNANKAPVAVKDEALTSKYYTISVDVLKNDYDTEDNSNATLSLVSVWFENEADNGVKGTVTINDATKQVVFKPNESHTYTPDEIVKLRYVIQDAGSPVRLCDEGILEVKMKDFSVPSSTIFSDDIWFFGNNEGVTAEGNPTGATGTPFTSRGIQFKEINGVITPTDFSGKSLVNSWENSLSVSTPACNGDFIFYTSHDMIYNSNNDPLKSTIVETSKADGKFFGNVSISDGLAACYIGNNNYYLFSISTDITSGAPRRLYYYNIDLNGGDDKRGEISMGGLIELEGLSEAIELVPKMGTSDEYWLVYFLMGDNITKKNEMKVYSVSKTGINFHQRLPLTVENPGGAQYFAVSLKSNHNYDKIAMAFLYDIANDLIVFNFDPLNGILSVNKTFPTTAGGAPGTNKQKAGGVEFSKNGRFLYMASGGNSPAPLDKGFVYQYDFNSPTGDVKSIEYHNDPSINYEGGGIKMGPDGRIYVLKQKQKDFVIIPNPDIKFGETGGGLLFNDFSTSLAGFGMRLSTGLTPPWVDPAIPNTPPEANPDAYLTYEGINILNVNPLINDKDNDGNIHLFMSSIDYINANDSLKVTLKKDKIKDNKISFLIKNNYSPSIDTIIRFKYIVRDKGAPIQLCDEGGVAFFIKKVSNIMLKDSCSFSPELCIDMGYPTLYTIIWEKANKDNPSTPADWDVVAGEQLNTLSLKGSESGKTYQYRYRIKETSTGSESVNSSPIKIDVDAYKMVNKTWYKISSN